MTTGRRILKARQEAGLSQRQLAGDTITRNMLSLLEHDQANPSLETLRYLSGRLGRPVSYFLGEEGAELPGREALLQAREALARGDYAACIAQADRIPADALLRPEGELLRAEAALGLAEQLLAAGGKLQVRKLLSETDFGDLPCGADLYSARRAVLWAEAAEPEDLPAAAEQLPSVDRLLLLQARAALAQHRPEEAARALDAVRDRDSRWNLLRGECYFAAEQWQQALECYEAAEAELPRQVRRGLQLCWAKLGNFEKAYAYATMEE